MSPPAPPDQSEAGRPAAAEAPPSEQSRLARSAGLVGLATAASRVLGLVREQTQAWLFGASLSSDAFTVAFRIPNLLRDLFAEGALSSAFLPQFTRTLSTSGKDDAFRLANQIIGAVLILVGVLTVGAFIWTEPLVRAMAGGFANQPGKVALTVTLTRIMLPFLLCISLSALAMGMLNAMDHFVVPALAPTMFNVGMIVVGCSIAVAAPGLGIEPVVGLAIGAMVGGLGQLLVQVPALWRAGFRPWPTLAPSDPGVRNVFSLMVPAIIGQSATQVNLFVNTQIASWLAQGSISWLSFAFRLMQLPIGMFGVSIGTVNMPTFTRHLAAGDLASARATVTRSLRLVLALTIPASVGLITLSVPIVALLYQYRKFTAVDTQQTAAALACYSIGLAGFSAVKVLVPCFYSLGEPRTPLITSAVSVGVNIGLNLFWWNRLGHQGLALATSITGLLNAALLLPGLSRRLGGLDLRDLSIHVAKVGLASLGMALASGCTSGAVAGWLGRAGFVERLVEVILAVGTGVVALLAGLRFLGVPESEDLVRLVMRKLGRSPGSSGPE